MFRNKDLYHIDLMMLEHGKTAFLISAACIHHHGMANKEFEYTFFSNVNSHCCNCIVFQCYDVFMCTCM